MPLWTCTDDGEQRPDADTLDPHFGHVFLIAGLYTNKAALLTWKPRR
jgi:hypothetical protein